MPFEVLEGFPKGCGGDVLAMEWCPTMDLIALITSDSQILVHRVTWQRLFVISVDEQPVRCLAWRPDGKQLAAGHADGSVTLYDVEDGEQLSRHREHPSPLCLFSWVEAAPAGRQLSPAGCTPCASAAHATPPLFPLHHWSSHPLPLAALPTPLLLARSPLLPSGESAARESPYVGSLAGLFAPLPQLPKQATAQQLLMDEGAPQLDAPLRHLLFEAHQTLGFDVAVTADTNTRVHLAVSGTSPAAPLTCRTPIATRHPLTLGRCTAASRSARCTWPSCLHYSSVVARRRHSSPCSSRRRCTR